MSVDAKKGWGSKFPENYYRDCVGRPRPCPWFRCKHHLLLDVNPKTGTITLNVGRVTKPGKQKSRRVNVSRRLHVISSRGDAAEDALLKAGETKVFDELKKALETGNPPTCVLDCVQHERTYTLEEIGDIFNITRERVRQIESKAERKLRSIGGDKDYEEWRIQTEA